MKKIEYNIYARDGFNASSKAKMDVSLILSKCNYKKLYKPSNRRAIRIIQQFVSIISLPRNSEIFIQYQSNKPFFYKLLSKLWWVKKVALIHDLESLRGTMTIKDEVGLLNGFDIIISHNQQMTNYLKQHNIIKPIINLGIFDYLLPEDVKVNNEFAISSLFFAGNLQKSFFLSKLSFIENVEFNIYGARFDGIEQIISQNNVIYKGSYRPEELIANIEGGWGLVWDGDSLDTCTGTTGGYLKYNNPHKVSMCIVSERPVIIWEQAAMADYINSKGLGIAVKSLREIPSVIGAVSKAEYCKYLDNVRKEKSRLVSGQNLLDALKTIN